MFYLFPMLGKSRKEIIAKYLAYMVYPKENTKLMSSQTGVVLPGSFWDTPESEIVLEKSFAHDLQQLEEQIREGPPKCSLLYALTLFPGHPPFSSFY